MGMRKNCKHYFRRTITSGGVVEACAIDVAPDAPERCPQSCPMFEKRNLSTAGFVYGSLAPKIEDGTSAEPDTGEMAVLDDLREFVDGIGGDIVREEEAKRKKKKRKPRRKRFGLGR